MNPFIDLLEEYFLDLLQEVCEEIDHPLDIKTALGYVRKGMEIEPPDFKHWLKEELTNEK